MPAYACRVALPNLIFLKLMPMPMPMQAKFDGHVFVTTKGTQFKCSVEYAPFQKVCSPRVPPRLPMLAERSAWSHFAGTHRIITEHLYREKEGLRGSVKSTVQGPHMML